MLPRSTGAVGGGTRHVAQVVWRVAGLTCAVARWPSAVTRAVLHTLFLPPTSGAHDVRSFSRAFEASYVDASCDRDALTLAVQHAARVPRSTGHRLKPGACGRLPYI